MYVFNVVVPTTVEGGAEAAPPRDARPLPGTDIHRLKVMRTATGRISLIRSHLELPIPSFAYTIVQGKSIDISSSCKIDELVSFGGVQPGILLMTPRRQPESRDYGVLDNRLEQP